MVPTWTGTAKYATHFSPTMELNRNEYAGISVAWMLYRGKDDANASTYFLGKDYKLSKDDQFFQLRINPLRVQRNKLADKLNPLSPVGNVTTTQ